MKEVSVIPCFFIPRVGFLVNRKLWSWYKWTRKSVAIGDQWILHFQNPIFTLQCEYKKSVIEAMSNNFPTSRKRVPPALHRPSIAQFPLYYPSLTFAISDTVDRMARASRMQYKSVLVDYSLHILAVLCLHRSVNIIISQFSRPGTDKPRSHRIGFLLIIFCATSNGKSKNRFDG